MRSIAQVVILISLVSQTGLSESVTIEKIAVPHVVTIDRRPSPNIVYSRCFGLFVTDNKRETLAAAKTRGDRLCPGPSALIGDLNLQKGGTEKFVTDEGETVCETADVDSTSFEKKADLNGKTYGQIILPTRVSIMGAAKSNGTRDKLDSFFVVYAESEGTSEPLVVACDNITTLKSCFDSRFESHKPLPDPNATLPRVGGSKSSDIHTQVASRPEVDSKK